MRITERDFLAAVAAHAGDHTNLEAVRAATHAVLSVTGAHLSTAVRQLVADELCAPLGGIVVAAEAGTALPIQEHILTPDMTVARADELIASVFTVLAEELSYDVLALLQRELPPDLLRRLNPPVPATREKPIRTHEAAPGNTLAGGRPGSQHPVSEAQPAHRHTDSVAATNPHADRKVSSAVEGARTEGDTLATGHVGSSRPLIEKR